MSTRRPLNPDPNEAPAGGGHRTPYHPAGSRPGQVASDASGRAAQVSDAPPVLISILAAMVAEAIEYEREEGMTDGT